MTSFSGQPLDPDAPSVRRGVPVPWRHVAAVWAGGTIGCALRAGLDLVLQARDGVPTVTLAVNLLGALLLGLLVESLALRGDDSGVRRRQRLVWGTGLLGGFTTYSTFALGTVAMLREGEYAAATAYASATVLGGSLLAWAGIALARRIGAPR